MKYVVKLLIVIIILSCSSKKQTNKQSIKINLAKIDKVYLKKEFYGIDTVELSQNQINLFVNKWNNSESKGLYKMKPRFYMTIKFKNDSIRNFRVNGQLIKEQGDWAFSIGDSVLINSFWKSISSSSKTEVYSQKTDINFVSQNKGSKKVVNRDSINEFLNKPFDLFEFKKSKNGSLSAGAAFKEYHFKPDFKYVAYQFFMFEPKTINYIDDGKEIRHQKIGYIGRSKDNTCFLEDGIVITTIQPLDKYKNQYLNPNEILIELVAKYNDFDLPEFAFVGLDSLSITNKLGPPYLYEQKCLIYQNKSKALILKIKNSRVIWLKYIYLKEGIDIMKNPKILEI